jgi:glycosyltransferase involved in cell wall biosynthesis
MHPEDAGAECMALSTTNGQEPGGRVQRRVSLVVPVFNEQDGIAPFVAAIRKAMAPLADSIRVDMVFVNDGSSDGTERVLRALAASEPDVTVINLSRNFGKEAALSAGIFHATGDAVIPIDVDLQDPPELIPQMIARWQQGAMVVNARRVDREADTWIKRQSAGTFYRVFNLMAERPIPENVGDFRLLDREVVNVIRSMGERSRFNKAIFSWPGFETEEVQFERPARDTGTSTWPYWKLWKLALDGIFASSTVPLRFWSYFGAIMFICSIAYALFILVRTLILGIDTPGYASTIIAVLTFGGLNLFALGLVGEYVGRIYTEVRQRPLYVVRSVLSSQPQDGN